MIKDWDKFYKKKNGNEFPNTNLVSFFNRNFANIKKKFDILDLGCGAGLTIDLTDKKNFSFDLVDISSKIIKKVNRKYKNKNFRSFVIYFNKFLENSEKSYDLIIDIASLQHQTKQNFEKSFYLIKKNNQID